ncbi:hypothetical protein LCGC14_0678460 [marine sediment metagenome]|uniref:Uncharacterized protein n=2 Tax=root TaxID=1 RepID=A0A9C9NJK7_9HYPH|nr:hypothetical protein [Aurantimonas coralicida]
MTETIAQALGSTDGTRMARCSDCSEQHEVAQVAWDLAMMFHEALVARGEAGLSGVARCASCKSAWKKACAKELEEEHYRDVALFRRMRRALASIEAREATRQDVVLFIASLPDDFRIEHHAAVASFRSEADKRFAELDKKRRRKGEDFDG